MDTQCVRRRRRYIQLLAALLNTALALIVVTHLCCCGGGSQSANATPPPASAPSYTLMVGPNTVTLQQGGSPQEVTLQEIPIGSVPQFTVTVSFPNLPTGIAVYPSGPITLSSPSDVATIMVVATSAATTGQLNLNIDSANGYVSQTTSLPINVSAAAPFQINLSSNQLSVEAGSSGSIQVSTTSSTTSLPDVSLEFSTASTQPDLESPVVTGSEPGPFTVTFYPNVDSPPIANVPVFVTASTNSGETSTAILNVSVTSPFPAITAATRSNFVQTNDNPAGAVYDSARKLVFATLPDLNEVVVLSSTNQQLVATIPVEQPGAIDESADGSTVFVGSLSKIFTLSPTSYQVTGSEPVPATGNLEATPVGLVALSTGNVLVLNGPGGHVFLWSPTAGTMTPDDPSSFPSPVGGPYFLARSADRTTVVLSSRSGYSPVAVVYNAAANSYSAPYSNVSFQAGATFSLSPDGSRVAVSGSGPSGVSGLYLYDSQFNLLSSLLGGNPDYPGYSIFSLDGTTLYTIFSEGNIGAAYTATTLAPKGLFLMGQQYGMEPLAIDETGMIFGSTSLGLSATDASDPGEMLPDTNLEPSGFPATDACSGNSGPIQPGTTFPPVPSFSFPNVLCPSTGSLTNPESSAIVGNGFDQNSNYSVFVGAPPASPQATAATEVSVKSPLEVDLLLPKGSVPEPANVTFVRSDGWYEILPDAVTYGPTIVAIDPDTVPPSGQTTINIYGYGFATPGLPVTVTIGGQAATIGSVGPIANGTIDLTPLETMQVTVPAGTPGSADVTVTTVYGSTTLSGGVQYLESAQVYPLAGDLNSIVYDQQRQRLYVANTNNNRVELFDLTTNTFLSPIAVGNNPTYMALTPDGAELAVLNSTDNTISVINPSTEAVISTESALTPQDKASFGQALSLTSLTPHRIVENVGAVTHVLNLDTGVISCAGVPGCDSTGTNLAVGFTPAGMASSPDGSQVFFTSGSVQVALLNLSNSSLTTGQGLPNGSSNPTSAAADGDDNIFSTGFGAFNGQLGSLNVGAIEYYFTLNGLEAEDLYSEALNPSGSLLFVPRTGSGVTSNVDIFDVHRGRLALRIRLPEGTADTLNELALDETGTKMFVITQSGITVAQLAADPLSVASVSPASAATGTQLTIRGSGFQSGATVMFGSSAATTTFVDSMTLQVTVPALPNGPVQVTVTNPGGQQYSFDAAFTVN
jgi:YVTN family beta-propeller protein